MAIRVWRLSKAKFARTPLDGEGARLYGGRWNSPGTALVYTSSTLALAELELLVHVDRADAPTDLVAIELEIPARLRVETVDAADLPPRWKRYPAPANLARIGDEWASSLRSAVLRVPSAVVPREFNYLFNPLHPDIARIKEVGREKVVFDERLFDALKRPRTGGKSGSKPKRRR